MMTSDDGGEIKSRVVESLQECIYDLESAGQLIDAGAIRKSLVAIKDLDEQSVIDAVQTLSKEHDNEVADSGRSSVSDTPDSTDSHDIDSYIAVLAASISSTVERLLKLR